MVQWIFFDVGNVILNDDPAMAMLYKLLWQRIRQAGHGVPFELLCQERVRHIQESFNGHHFKEIARVYLGDEWRSAIREILHSLTLYWDKVCPLLPGITNVIHKAADHFRLGIIANQPEVVLTTLEKHHLLHYFQVIAVSKIVGFQKPDLRLFKYALTEAGCQPSEAIMIGDRIDNDVRPARLLGMKTIWFPLALDAKGYIPKESFEKKFYSSLQQATISRIPPLSPDEEPDATVISVDELLPAIFQTAEEVN